MMISGVVGGRTVRVLAASAAMTALAAGGGGLLAGRQQPGAGGAAGRCAALDAALPGVRLLARHARAATAATADAPAQPAHCEVVGEADRRTGVDGQSYAIRFRLRLPDAWNRRFFFQGGGGSNGVVGDAQGNLQGGQADTALLRGYAVVSQDSGHDNAVNNRADAGGIASFGFDPVARANYAYASLPRVTDIAKALIARHYGAPPARSYFVGCSKGGQEGMALAERHPTYFDGIIANAPGFALPRAALAQAHDVQVLGRLATARRLTTADGLPRIGSSFTDAQLGRASQAVLSACDALDGLADGIVAATGQCTSQRMRPALRAATCGAGASGGDCLSPDQVAALETIMAGARDSRGRALYSDWPWDAGIGGRQGPLTFADWRRWKLGSETAPVADARNVLLGAASLASVFTTPPTRLRDDPAALLRFQLALDLAGARGRTEAAGGGFARSAWSLMAANDADRDAFRRAGGRMIVMHGAADPVFSLNDTLGWWTRLDARYSGHASDFTRVFAVPGMNHCRGGPATSRFDAFAALVAWVERGRAPNMILGTAPPGTPWPGRTRPLCAHPAIARHVGSGDPERADSFRCVAP